MTEQSGDQQTLKLGDKVYSYTERDGVIEYNITGVRLYKDAIFYEIIHSDIELLIVDNGLYPHIFEYVDVIEDDKCTGFSSKYPKLYYENKKTAVHDYMTKVNSEQWKKIERLEEEILRLRSKADKLRNELKVFTIASGKPLYVTHDETQP